MKKQILEYVITISVCLIVGFLICVFEGIFSYKEEFRILGILCDACFIPGVFTFGIGVLIFVANNGVFDMLVYGVTRFFSLFRKDPRKNKYETFYDYHVAQAEKPKMDFAFLFIVGGGLLILSVVFLLIWRHYYDIAVTELQSE